MSVYKTLGSARSSKASPCLLSASGCALITMWWCKHPRLKPEMQNHWMERKRFYCPKIWTTALSLNLKSICWWFNVSDTHRQMMAWFSVIIWRLPPTLKSRLNIWSYFLSFAFFIFLFRSLFLSVAPLLPKYVPPNSSSSPEDYFSIRHVYSGILAWLERNPLREEE